MKRFALLLVVGAVLGFLVTGGGSPPVRAAENLIDSDNDGCTDDEELGANPALGGQRSPANPWDFFDTPPFDNAISVSDILRVVNHFGETSEHPNYDWHFDQGKPLGPSEYPWHRGEPDGVINIAEIALAVWQFGHHCDKLDARELDIEPGSDELVEAVTGHTIAELEEWVRLNIASRSIAQHLDEGTLSVLCKEGDVTTYAINIEQPDWETEQIFPPGETPWWIEDLPKEEKEERPAEPPPDDDCAPQQGSAAPAPAASGGRQAQSTAAAGATYTRIGTIVPSCPAACRGVARSPSPCSQRP